MEIRLADSKDKQKIIKYDNHIHHNKVGECIWNQLVYVLCDEKNYIDSSGSDAPYFLWAR